MLPLRVFLNERLSTVAEEILGAVEKTIAVYQEEILRSKDLEIRQLRMQLKLIQSKSKSESGFEAEAQHSPPPPSASPSVLPHQSPIAVAAVHEEGQQQQQQGEEDEDGVCCVDEELPETSQVKEESEGEDGKRHFWMVHDSAGSQEDQEAEAQEFISPHTGLPTTLREQALYFQQFFNSNNGGGNSSSGDESSSHRPYICSVCEKRFTNCSHLAAHIRTHTGERPYMCDICRKTFITTSALNRHQTIHTEGKRYICADCGKSFKWMESLGRHVRSVHKSDNVQV